MQRILDLVNDFQQGNMARAEYWTAMQRFHVGLQDYADLIQDGRVTQIEITRAGLQIVLPNGLRMIWNPGDMRAAPNAVINHGEYEREELALLEFLARDCRVLFDVGANTGWYTLHLAHQLRASGGKVYAFEPIPQTYAELTRNIALNHCAPTVVAQNVALSDVEQTIQLYVPALSGSAAASQRQLMPNETNQTFECQALTLDTFARQQSIARLDLIKCDVEGAELFVLRGGLGSIATHKPMIMLEMLRKWARLFAYHPNDIIALLSRYGYACWSFEQGRLVPVSQVDEACVQTNFFFLHCDKHADVPARVNQHWEKERQAK